MLAARTVGSMVEMAPHERCCPDGGGRHGPRQNQIIANPRRRDIAKLGEATEKQRKRPDRQPCECGRAFSLLKSQRHAPISGRGTARSASRDDKTPRSFRVQPGEAEIDKA